MSFRTVSLCLAALVLAAGCLGADPPEADPTPSLDPCPVQYPDGTPFDCTQIAFKPPTVQPQPPALNSGWGCYTPYRHSDGFGIQDIYVHQDGRVGVYWDVNLRRTGGFGFLQYSIYTAQGNLTLLLPYQARGFAEFEQKPPTQTGYFRALTLHFLLDIGENTTWAPAPNASIVVGNYHGHPWYVWTYDSPDGPTALDLMRKNADPSDPDIYNPSTKTVDHPGWDVWATVYGKGVNFPNRTFQYDPSRLGSCTRVT